MDWASVIENPFLRDLPFKVELSKLGQVLMSPASNRHGRIQSRVVVALARRKKDGEIITECSLETSEGVRVADVAWASDDFIAHHGYQTPYPRAPELCVEIISPSNSSAEIEQKIGLYLAQGAQEVWIVDEDEGVAVHGREGRRDASQVVPGFSL